MLLAKQDRSDPDVGRTLLGADTKVLRGAHRELVQAVLGGERARAARTTGASPRGRLRRAASSSGRGRRRRGSRRSPPAARPTSTPRRTRFTSRSAGTSSRRAAECESSEWTSSQIRLTTLTLFDCRWPMKCQRNASPYSACFASRSCARFSPTTSIARLDEQRHVGERDVLRRGDDRHRRPDLGLDQLVALADPLSRRQPDHPLPAGDAAVAPVREEELGMARVHRSKRSTARHPPRAGALGRRSTDRACRRVVRSASKSSETSGPTS